MEGWVREGGRGKGDEDRMRRREEEGWRGGKRRWQEWVRGEVKERKEKERYEKKK